MILATLILKLFFYSSFVGYALGSIPFGLLIGRINGIDIREHGSGNIGATNVARVVGKGWGVVALLMDGLKGLGPVLIVPLMFADSPKQHIQVAAGISAALGHMFPVWLKFRGGKGVATALGVVLVLSHSYWVVLAALGAFLLSFAIWKIVSVSSMLAVVAYGIAQIVSLSPQPFSSDKWSLAAFSIAIPLLIIYRHRSNIVRLLRGEEPRFKDKAKGKSDVEGRADGDLAGTDGSDDEDGAR